MMPPAMRKAAEADAERAQQILAEQGEEEQDARPRSAPSGSPSRGGAPASAPRVRPAKIGAQPGGSITTRKVTKAETNSSVTAPPAPAGRRARWAATRVLRSRTAMVIGPTPPGTGVIAPATSLAAGEIDVADQPGLAVLGAGTRLMPTSITVAPGFSQSPLTISGRPTAATTMSARRTTSGRSRVRLWAMVTVQFSREQQLRHRLADDVGAADHHRLEPGQVAEPVLEQHQAAERRAGHERRPRRPRAGRH